MPKTKPVLYCTQCGLMQMKKDRVCPRCGNKKRSTTAPPEGRLVCGYNMISLKHLTNAKYGHYEN